MDGSVASPRQSGAREALVADVWRRMLACFEVQRERMHELLADLAISFGDMRALLVLDADTPRPMRALADAWACDASNATWMVDRLEQRGLVDRRVLPNDRRVKAVALTPAGLELKGQLLARLHEPPPELAALDSDELEALRGALAKLGPARTP